MAFRLAAGLVVLHGLLLGLDLAGIRWSRLSIGIPVLALAALGLRRRGRVAETRPRRHPLGWGDGLAAGTIAVFAILALARRVANPDFIYHWGLKAKRFALAGGVDLPFLQAGWNSYAHPDYPNLVPNPLGSKQNSYHWSMAEKDGDLWVGTVRNVLCFLSPGTQPPELCPVAPEGGGVPLPRYPLDAAEARR